MVCSQGSHTSVYHRSRRPFRYFVAVTWVIFTSDSVNLSRLLPSAVFPQLFFFFLHSLPFPAIPIIVTWLCVCCPSFLPLFFFVSFSLFILPHIYNLFLFFKLYFIDYAITVVLISPPLSPFTHHSPLPQTILTPLFMSMGHVYKFFAPFPTLYFTSPWLFCNYLFILLNPLTSSPIPHTPLHLATLKTFSISMILSLCLFPSPI